MSSFPLSAIGLVLSTTLGAAIGAIGSALVGARSHRNEGASALVDAATQLTDRLLKRNNDLTDIEQDMRRMLIRLSDAVTVCERQHPHVSDDAFDELHQANRAAQEML
jgi:hypothetical protein